MGCLILGGWDIPTTYLKCVHMHQNAAIETRISGVTMVRACSNQGLDTDSWPYQSQVSGSEMWGSEVLASSKFEHL